MDSVKGKRRIRNPDPDPPKKRTLKVIARDVLWVHGLINYYEFLMFLEILDIMNFSVKLTLGQLGQLRALFQL